MSSSDDELLRFINASFPSVWALELLLALKRDRRSWSHAELLSAMRASELVVSKALDALVVAGLASADASGVRYQPVTSDVDACVELAEQLYRSRPNMVRRAIVSARMGSATAFSDAFRLRKD
jgi:hypothetical protein